MKPRTVNIPQEMTPDVAYILGAMLGDGTVYTPIKRKKGGIHWKVGITSNKEYHLGDGLNAEYRHTTFSKLKTRLKKIGFFTNPIDDQGYCTYDEKFDLFEQVISKIAPAIKRQQVTVLLKTHVREKTDAYCAVLEKYL